jgi:hypothetical protein
MGDSLEAAPIINDGTDRAVTVEGLEDNSAMWLQFGLAGGAVALLLLLVVNRAFRRRSGRIEVGPVSEAWLAEQRSRAEHD